MILKYLICESQISYKMFASDSFLLRAIEESHLILVIDS